MDGTISSGGKNYCLPSFFEDISSLISLKAAITAIAPPNIKIAGREPLSTVRRSPRQAVNPLSPKITAITPMMIPKYLLITLESITNLFSMQEKNTVSSM